MHRYRFPCQPLADSSNVVGSADDSYRFTVLDDGLLRLEWSQEKKFEDRASTFAINHNLSPTKFRVLDHGQDGLEIITSRFKFHYDKKVFTPSGLSVQVLGSMTQHGSVWRYSTEVKNLGGKSRTLDEADGRIELGPAVISRRGFALIDDSKSMVFDSRGWISTRQCKDGIDLYLFLYGHDYLPAIKILYAVSGHQPLLPRWALGNWWSRYHAYSEHEYLELMDEFREKGIPMSVVVLDMDWHLIKQDASRKAGLTLNDHPADGIANYEDACHDVAKALDHDTSNGDSVPFDITKRRFCDAFFDVLHRRIEHDSGCDFWWIDWQQGPYSRIPGIDPLWMLNHFHYLDSTRPGRHPLIFSRFAGPGSHRYPIGFSGDTVISWASLEFQPEFTNCASNIGYGWWSHDIGGHMHGKRDNELQTRWLQYGVFSPIMRLHSISNPWNTKEPWKFRSEHTSVQVDFLRLRHKLVPYLQTMNVVAARDGVPLCRPIYWSYTEIRAAYEVPNQYMFGGSMIVVPITRPCSLTTYLAKAKAWLPPGTHVDLFTGTMYDGDRSLWLHRRLQEYPVLVRCGAIIPMDGAEVPENGCTLPNHLEVIVVPGADGTFKLLEEQSDENGVASPDETTVTMFTFSQAEGVLTVTPRSSIRGTQRNWTIRFHGCQVPEQLQVILGNKSFSRSPERLASGFKLNPEEIPSGTKIIIAIGSSPKLEIPSPFDQCSEILSAAQTEFDLKAIIGRTLKAELSILQKVSQLHNMDMDKDLLDALLEQLRAWCE
ncbi:hypothetical protein N7476_004868 [Penicillium atrosanguineum]|uniref:alpha-glucosidase n=1 Tax=Penicillium atrosanguineum TaxID=1132637 RepID=A0A9W9U531_9EURO|nr:hypothetical protein N7476_004868 [Penicillium atrosanguineum]